MRSSMAPSRKLGKKSRRVPFRGWMVRPLNTGSWNLVPPPAAGGSDFRYTTDCTSRCPPCRMNAAKSLEPGRRASSCTSCRSPSAYRVSRGTSKASRRVCRTRSRRARNWSYTGSAPIDGASSAHLCPVKTLPPMTWSMPHTTAPSSPTRPTEVAPTMPAADSTSSCREAPPEMPWSTCGSAASHGTSSSSCRRPQSSITWPWFAL
mmetsp:Transcript_77999/g.131011  ORF Transcript_77999/g.131011 Transcript_77999/m.131011 type:complete len:206 (+) Transcript_77999:603-1220(+)